MPAHQPFAVEHRVPRRVAVFAFNYHMLAEDAFKAESVAQGCAPARPILRVALPFVAPVSQSVEHLAGHQEHRFGGPSGPRTASHSEAVCRSASSGSRVTYLPLNVMGAGARTGSQ